MVLTTQVCQLWPSVLTGVAGKSDGELDCHFAV